MPGGSQGCGVLQRNMLYEGWNQDWTAQLSLKSPACIVGTGHAMTSKETGKSDAPPDGTERDFATLADQWADENWYLPPGGDQSWRDREAQRLFGGDGEELIDERQDRPRLDPSTDEVGGSYEPGFKHRGALGIALPLLLAASAAFSVPVFMPQVLTSGFWNPYEPKAPSDMPVQIVKLAEDDVTLRPAYGDGSDRSNAADQALSQPAGKAVAPIKIYRNSVLPDPRPAIVTRNDPKDSEPSARIAEVQPSQAPSPRIRPAKSLPPIGAAYFASHAPAAGKQIADSTRPIGQAYFESHSPARTD